MRRGREQVMATLGLALLSLTGLSSQQDAAPRLPTLSELNAVSFSARETGKMAGAPRLSALDRALTAFAVFCDPSTAPKPAIAPGESRGPNGARVYRTAAPTVVFISAVAETVNGNISKLDYGTGVILHPSGEVLTNWHVVATAQKKNLPVFVFIKPPEGTDVLPLNMHTVRPDYWNESKDLALLTFEQRPIGLRGLPLSDMAAISVAQDIHIIGHPLGQRNAWTYSTGTVSQVRRGYKATIDGGTQLDVDVVQIQSAINPGNSGGPILDDNSNIVGLVSFGQGENLHFGIAASEISALLGRREARRKIATTSEPEATYSGGTLADGRNVAKVTFDRRSAFLLLDGKGRPMAMVADAGNGATLRAWAPNSAGAFTRWSGATASGTPIEVDVVDGQPARLYRRTGS